MEANVSQGRPTEINGDDELNPTDFSESILRQLNTTHARLSVTVVYLEAVMVYPTPPKNQF